MNLFLHLLFVVGNKNFHLSLILLLLFACFSSSRPSRLETRDDDGGGMGNGRELSYFVSTFF